MNGLIKQFSFDGGIITFEKSNSNVMVNATEMAKKFGKRVSNFLQNESTTELINCISVKTGIPASDLITITHGGNNQGTWMHSDLALIFAQWLNPMFYLWCNDKVKELMQSTLAMPNFNNPAEVARAWADEYEKRVIAERTIEIQAPKVEYYEKALSSESLFTTNSIALCLGMSAIALNEKLKLAGVQYKQGGVWLLSAKYRDTGIAQVINVPFATNSGEIKSNPQMKWTEKGKQFIFELKELGRI